MKLTRPQRDELSAIREANDMLGSAAFMFRTYRDFYDPMIDAGLVKWGDPPGTFDPKLFAGVMITDAGRAALDSMEG